jgi:hypothetical protein
MKKSKILLLSFILIQLFVPTYIVYADAGPKPSMAFEFKQGVSDTNVTIVSGTLYECNQPDCSDAAPLEERGPQRFTCEVDRCQALAYGFAPYHRLEIEFSDGKTRQSNIFETAGFSSKYTVIIQPDDLLVEARFNPTALLPAAIILIACICVLVVIGLVAGVIIFMIRRSTRK